MRSHFRGRRASRRTLHLLLALGLAAFAPEAGAQIVPCANCGAGTLSGTVFNDANGSHTNDSGDSPIPGALVRLIDDRGQNAGTTTTNALGQYTFAGLPCGNYTVAEDVPTGWTQTTPDLSVAGIHVAFLGTPGQTIAGLDFGRMQERCLGAGDLADNLNSGFDEANATALGTSGVPDDDWLHTATYPVSAPPQQPYCTDPNGNPSTGPQFLWLQPSAPAVTKTYSAWAGPQASSRYVTGFPANSTPNGNHFYQHCFCLAENFERPILTYSLYADDYARVYLNGNLLYTSPVGSFSGLPHPRPGAVQPLDPTPFFHPGFNCITVEVINTGQVVTAFDFVGQLTAASGRCCVAPPPPEGGNLFGGKWNDLDADGVRDPGEPGLAGWTLQLVDAAGNVVATATTDASGLYTFSNVPPGSYTIVEVQQAGWSQTAPPGGSHTVTVQGQAIDGLDFGNVQKSCALVEKPRVACGDQAPFIFDFDLTNVAPFTVTQVDFYNFSPANFTITPDPMAVNLATGQTQHFQVGISGPGAVSGALLCFSIKLHDAAERNCCSIDTCIQLPECHHCNNHIQGAKYLDANRNGVRDVGEQALAGWTIVLTDSFGNTTTTTTDAFGNYWFVNLAFGTYTVSEVQQAGLVQTAPAGGTHIVTFTNANGAVVNNLDFGNRRRRNDEEEAINPTASGGR